MARLRPYLPLVLIAVAAFALRLAVIHVLRPTCAAGSPKGITGECFPLFGDTQYVTVQAEHLSQGHGFIDSNTILYGKAGPEVPGAAHPPMFTIFLAALDKVGFDGIRWWRAATALVGSVGVALVGLVAWRLSGDRSNPTGRRSRNVGAIAAGIAAVDPLLWSRDADLMVESLVIPLACLVILSAYRLWRRPSFSNASLLGIAVGISWLTRAELILWLPCMVPMLWGLKTPAGDKVPERLRFGTRVGLLATAGGVACALMAPWVLYNLGRFQHPVYISTNLGMASLLGSCDATYYGAELGYWTFECVDPVDTSKVRDDSESERLLSAAARTYIGDHPGRTVVTAFARTGRFWAVYQPIDTVDRWDGQEGMGTFVARSSWVALMVSLPLAVVGGIGLRRRRVPISPVLAPVLVATAAATILIPIPRFRVAADVALVIMAAIGIDITWQWLRRQDKHLGPATEDPIPIT